MTLMLIFFSMFSGFSGQTLIDSWVITVYNLFFTSWPIVIFALFERDLNHKYLMRYPELYNRSQNNSDFNIRVRVGQIFYFNCLSSCQTFAFWLLSAVWHGFAFFFCVWFLWDYGLIDTSGKVFGMWSMGVACMTACVIVVTIKISMETQYAFVDHFSLEK